MMLRALSLSAAVCLVVAQPLAALPPLSDNADVTEGLIAVGMAVELSDKCAALSPRTVRGLLFLNSLKSTARTAGYSDAQIDAYVGDKAEKKRLESVARARLAELGAVSDQPETYCSVGRAQIAAGTSVGRLLKD